MEDIFRKTYFRDENGRFVVTIPLNPNVKELGSSRAIALKRFLMLEKRFQRDREFHRKYVETMREYEQLGHMIPASNEIEQNQMVY